MMVRVSLNVVLPCVYTCPSRCRSTNEGLCLEEKKFDFQAGEFSKHNYAKIYSAVAIKAPGYVKSSLTAGKFNGAG